EGGQHTENGVDGRHSSPRLPFWPTGRAGKWGKWGIRTHLARLFHGSVGVCHYRSRGAEKRGFEGRHQSAAGGIFPQEWSPLQREHEPHRVLSSDAGAERRSMAHAYIRDPRSAI